MIHDITINKFLDLITSMESSLASMDSSLKTVVDSLGRVESSLEELKDREAAVIPKTVTATKSPEEQLERLKNIKKMFEKDGTLYETITRDSMLEQHAEKISQLDEKKGNLFGEMEGMLERLNTVKDILSTFSEGDALNPESLRNSVPENEEKLDGDDTEKE